jgi:glutaredoxin
MVREKFFIGLLIIFFISFASSLTIEEINSQSSVENITPIFFYGSGCPHCATASTFLETIEQKYNFLKVNRLEINQNIDLNHIVLETDSPYLSPVPNGGKRNESANLTHIAEKIAEIKKITLNSSSSI